MPHKGQYWRIYTTRYQAWGTERQTFHILCHMWKLQFVHLNAEYWLLETGKGYMKEGKERLENGYKKQVKYNDYVLYFHDRVGS